MLVLGNWTTFLTGSSDHERALVESQHSGVEVLHVRGSGQTPTSAVEKPRTCSNLQDTDTTYRYRSANLRSLTRPC